MDIMQLDVFAPAASPMDSGNLVGVGLLNSTDVAVNVVRISAGESVRHDDLPLNRIVIVLSGCGHVSDGINWHAFRAHQVMRWPADENHEIHADTDLTAMLIEWAGDYNHSPAVTDNAEDEALAAASADGAATTHAGSYTGTAATHAAETLLDSAGHAAWSDHGSPEPSQPSTSLPLQRPVLPGDNWDGVTERRKGSDRRWSLVPKAMPSRSAEEPERRVQGRRASDRNNSEPRPETTVGPKSSDPQDVAQWRAGYPKDYAPVTDLDGPSIFQSGYSSSTWEAEDTEQAAVTAAHLADSSDPAEGSWIRGTDRDQLSTTEAGNGLTAQDTSDRWKQPAWSQEPWQSTTERPRGRRADLDKSVDALPAAKRTGKRAEVPPAHTAIVEQASTDQAETTRETSAALEHAEKSAHVEIASELGRRAELRAYMKTTSSSTPIYDGAAEHADIESPTPADSPDALSSPDYSHYDSLPDNLDERLDTE